MIRHTASTIDDEALDALYATLAAVSNRIQHTMIDAAEIHRQISQTLEPTPAAPSLRLVTDADAPFDAEIRQLREQLDAAEERAERVRGMVDAWERRLPHTIRTATAAQAVRQALDGNDAPVMFDVTPPAPDRTASMVDHYRQAAATAEAARKAAEQRAARAEEEATRVQAVRTRWAREADATILAHRQRAARYRTAWQSARRRAHLATDLEETLDDARVTAKRWADEADRQRQRAAELGNRLRLAHQARRAKEHQLDDIRRALCDAGIMRDDDPYSHADLADVIRQAAPAATEATDVPEPDSLAEAEHETLIADVRAVMRGASNTEALHRAAEGITADDDTPRPVSLATPCTNPECEHSLNWHTGTPGGVCVARGAACPCGRFQPPSEDRP